MGWTGTAYLGFDLAVFLVFAVVTVKKKLPWWQPLAVLALPLAAPAFIARSAKGRPLIWGLMVAGGLAGAIGLDYRFYSLYLAQNKYSDLPPVVRKMIILNDRVKDSTIAVYQASEKLNGLSMVQSRSTDIKSTLKVIALLQKLVRENQQDIDALVDYIGEQGEVIRQAHLDWALWIGEFYRDPRVVEHSRSRSMYLTAFGQMLQYTYDHYDQIMAEKSPQHRANYDAYYLRYRGVADRHNGINRQRIEFQNQFVQQHPEVKPFLPGSHHLEPFRFWDQFNF